MGVAIPETVARCEERSSQQRVGRRTHGQEPRSARTSDAVRSGVGGVQRARFTGEVINPGALCVVEKPVAAFLPLNLYDLGTTGLLHYVAGRSPYHPHDPLTGKPSREWRLKQACIVIESRAGVDTGARERFIAAAGGGGAEQAANVWTCETKSGARSPTGELSTEHKSHD